MRLAPVGEALEFMTTDSVQWTVREYASSGPSEDDHVPCLVFESADAMRRVREYPHTWRELGGAELLALSWMT